MTPEWKRRRGRVRERLAPGMTTAPQVDRPLANMSHSDMETASGLARRVLDCIARARVLPQTADSVAAALGFASRHALNRGLRRAKLPTYRRLAALATLTVLWDQADRNHRSIGAEAVAEGRQPRWAYRAVRRLTGLKWSDLRNRRKDDLFIILLKRDRDPPLRAVART